MNRKIKCIYPFDLMTELIEIQKMTHKEVGKLIYTKTKQVYKAMHKAWNKLAKNRTRNGELHPDWKGGRIIDKDGYVLVYRLDHPMSRKHNHYVLSIG